VTDQKQISELALIKTDKEISDDSRFFQVDVLKAAMIFLVIFDHIVSWSIKSDIGVALWERISIPVFLVILGFNAGKSFQRRETQKLRDLYSWNYFKSKILRYIVPFLILYAVSTFIGLFMYGFDISAMYHGQYYPSHGFINLFIGILPFWGPGNWFLPLLFQSILILPLLYKAFKKKPILSLFLCFVVEIAMQLTVFFLIGEITSWEEVHILNMFMTCTLFYLSAIGLGMWFSFGHKLEHKRNFFMWFLFPISLAFIIVHQFFDFRFRVDDVLLLRGDYHFLIFPYSAFLFLLAMGFLPQKSDGRISRVITVIGNSTYHILLTQILGYGMIYAYWGTHYAIDASFGLEEILELITVWALFISFGILWHKIDQNKDLLRRTLYYINFFIVFTSLLLFTFWAQGFWIPIPLIIILNYAIIALGTNYIIKRPIKTRTLGIWTLFLLLTFVMLVLQVEFFDRNEFWIPMIPIGAYLAFATMDTIIDYRL